MKKIGFGIVGTGAIAEMHAQAILGLEEADLIGVYNRTEEKARTFAKKHGVKVYGGLDEMMVDSEIEIVCICTASGFHLEPALAAIRNGKHCVIEKPLEITPDRCDAIIEEARRNKVEVSVLFQSRYYESALRINEAIENKKLGDLVLGSAYIKWSRTEEYYASADWRGTLSMDGGGALINQGIHTVDLLQWYMGDVVSVQALKANIKHKGIEGEDTVVAVLEFSSGALGTIECTTAGYPGYARRLELVGTEGSIVLEDNDLIKWDFKETENLDQKANVHETKIGGAADPMAIDTSGHKNQIKEVIEAIKGNNTTPVSAEEGSKSVRIVCAIYESAQTGKKIEL